MPETQIHPAHLGYQALQDYWNTQITEKTQELVDDYPDYAYQRANSYTKNQVTELVYSHMFEEIGVMPVERIHFMGADHNWIEFEIIDKEKYFLWKMSHIS